LKTAFVVDRYGENEKTVDEWIVHLKDEKNHMNREYSEKMIRHYAQRNQHGFSYKEYPDLPGEVWKEIARSKTKLGRWEISNMKRIKYVTKFAENVLSGERLGLLNGYPIININRKQWYCHILSLMTFFPEEWSAKKSNEIVLHEDDDKLDFRPHKLRLGSRSDNTIDAYNNGKYDDTKSARMKCVSYINGVYEIMHDSQEDAAKYLKSIGYKNAAPSAIRMVLYGDRKTAYKRTWKLI
jgi:hypothetical protein